MDKQQFDDFHGKYLKGVLEELQHEANLLREWFTRDFPESDLKVIVDVNNITKSFTITVRVLMGEEMVDNRGFFQNVLQLNEKDIINPSFMRAFFKHFGSEYRKQIADGVNKHYMREKSIENIG